MKLIEILNWRYATKRMNGKKVPAEKLSNILEAIRLSASSMGLQPYTIIVVENEELRKKLQPAINNQPQIVEGSHVIVFAAWDNINENQVEDYIENIAYTRGITNSSLEKFKTSLMEIVNNRTTEEKFIWAAKQAYIALGTALIAAANEQVDATPMEGFNPEEVDKILNLKEKGLKSVVILTLGYRNVEVDKLVKLPKVRRPKEKLFITF